MPVTAMFIPSSLQVFPHPRQAVFGSPRGRVCRTDQALVAEPVDEIEQGREIDLSGSGLVPAGNVGDLHMPDPRDIRRQGPGEIVSHGPHVKEVVLQFEIYGAYLVHERERLSRVVQIEPGDRLRTDGLDEQRHAVARQLGRRVAQVQYVGLVQLRYLSVRWRHTGETIHLFATERFGVLDRLRDAVAEFRDARRQPSDTAVAFLRIAR